MGLLDRHRLPAEAMDGLRSHFAEAAAASARRPRVLAWCETANGFLVALPDRLLFSTGVSSWTSLAWEELLSATWSDDGTMFAWRSVDRPYHLRSLAVSRPEALPGVVRERLERTIVARSVVLLAPDVPVTLMGRRPAVGDAEITWSVLPPKGVRLDTPELASAAEAALRRARLDLL